MLRRIADSVKDARQLNSACNEPQHRPEIEASYRPELVFLTLEIRRERHRNGQTKPTKKLY